MIGRVYLHKNDLELFLHHGSMTVRTEFAQFNISPEIWAQIEASDFVPDRQNTYLSVEGGTLFDLGSVTPESIYVPGHTQGMLCVLEREERSLLMGDVCNPYPCLPPTSPIFLFYLIIKKTVMRNHGDFS